MDYQIHSFRLKLEETILNLPPSEIRKLVLTDSPTIAIGCRSTVSCLIPPAATADEAGIMLPDMTSSWPWSRPDNSAIWVRQPTQDWMCLLRDAAHARPEPRI